MKVFAWETEWPKPDLAACQALDLGPGRFAVELAAMEDSRGGLLLSDRERKWRRPGLGIILAMGELPAYVHPAEGKPRAEWPRLRDQLVPGEAVFLNLQDGKSIEDFELNGYRAKNEVRLLGIVSPWVGLTFEVPWDESIYGAWDPMTRTARATGRNLLLKLSDKVEQTGSGLFLPDYVQSRTDVAEVLSVGAGVPDYKPGDRVAFNRRSLVEIHAEDGVMLAFIPASGIYGRVLEETSVAA